MSRGLHVQKDTNLLQLTEVPVPVLVVGMNLPRTVTDHLQNQNEVF